MELTGGEVELELVAVFALCTTTQQQDNERQSSSVWPVGIQAFLLP